MNVSDRARALASIANAGNPSPVDRARYLAAAWELYQAAGVPPEPGWSAAGHAIKRQLTETPAMALAQRLDGANGVVILHGGTGNGRTYACCRIFWRRAVRVATGRDHRAGVWLNAGEVGTMDRGAWMSLRKGRAMLTRLLCLDDAGAPGSVSDWGRERIAELLEARHRLPGLTLVTTNLTAKEFSAAYNARVMSRATWHNVAGADLRAGKPREEPQIPPEVAYSLGRIDAARRLDAAVVSGRAMMAAEPIRVIEEWLRGDLDQPAWDARLADELRIADAQLGQVSAAMSALVTKMAAKMAPPPDPTPELREANRARAGLAAAAYQSAILDASTRPRASVEAELRTLAGASTPDELRRRDALRAALRGSK